MKFEEYYITDSNGKSNCVIRTFAKVFNASYEDVANELSNISKEINKDFNDIETFEEYMNKRNFHKIEDGKDLQVKNLNLDNDTYIAFVYDKKDFYHMFPIINNTIYDRNQDCYDLYVITLYKR
jgi:tRNA/tmRNA/rRNA uracil-C5-methylase (TrmA/RlmC/RlmD family)